HTKGENLQWLKSADDIKAQIPIEIIPVTALTGSSLISSQLEKIETKCDAIFLLPDPMLFKDHETVKKLLDYCAQKKLPVISYSEKLLVHPAVALAIHVHSETVGSQIANIAEKMINNDQSFRSLSFSAGSSVSINLRHCLEMKINVNLENLDITDTIVE
ncbi:MAG: hypothetical protein ACRC37_00665, partial [Lentisphaeria bacterium]